MAVLHKHVGFIVLRALDRAVCRADRAGSRGRAKLPDWLIAHSRVLWTQA